MYEGKLRIPIRLKDRIEMLKNEREVKNGKIKFKQTNSE